MEKKIILSVSLLLIAIIGKAQILEVTLCKQEHGNWCWAGASQCILKYYDTNLRQCEIAEYTRVVSKPYQYLGMKDYGSEDCCEISDTFDTEKPCNQMNYMGSVLGTLYDILNHFGVANVVKKTPLSLVEIRTAIENKRLFALCWTWKGGGGHVVVGHGLMDSTLYYMDPWPGEGFKFDSYKEIVENDQRKWTDANIMSISPKTDPDPVSITKTTGFQQRIKISSNPSNTGKFVIENLPTTGISYNVYTINGQTIRQGKTSDATLHLSMPQKGIFMLKIWDKSNSAMQKLIVN